MSGQRHQQNDPIESYLDELLGALRGTPADVRRALAESEVHLRESAETAAAQGLSDDAAARYAIEHFGDVDAVANAFNRVHRPAALRALLPAVVLAGWRLVAVGLAAIGASGVVAWILTRTFGTAAVFADAPGVRHTPGACAYWLHLHPTATTCAQAALLETRDDVLLQRFALGVLGVAMLLAGRWWQRRSARPAPLRGPAALIAVTAFGLAGVALTGYGIDRAVQNTGAGQWLAAGSVAFAFAAGYVAVLWRTATRTMGT